MTENGLFVLCGPETRLHDILWAVHDGKTVVEVRARKISGSSRLRWEVGGRAMRVSLIHVARVCDALALTEPEQGVGLLTEPE